MNRSAGFHLSEVAQDARRVFDKFQAGRYDDGSEFGDLQIELEHLMGHLALAWHFAVRTDEQIDALSVEEFGKLMNAIPQLGLNQQLVEPWDKVI